MKRNTPAPVTAGYPLLQWANGKTEARTSGGRWQPLVGWHTEQGASPELDAHCQEMRVQVLEIKHRRPGGFEVKPHWYFGEDVRVAPLTPGPLADTMRGAARISEKMAHEAAIVAYWPQGEGSYLSLLVLAELGGAMHQGVLRLLVTSTLTDHLYAALVEHIRVCEDADAIIGKEVPPWWLLLPLTSGEELDAGRGETTTITPMRAAHAETTDRAVLNMIALPPDWRPYADSLVDEAHAWARDMLAARMERQAAA